MTVPIDFELQYFGNVSTRSVSPDPNKQGKQLDVMKTRLRDKRPALERWRPLIIKTN